jgi:hypothetical protein
MPDDPIRCLYCGEPLADTVWNKEVDLLYCPNWMCLKAHHPQIKRYLPTGRLEISRWILNARRLEAV